VKRGRPGKRRLSRISRERKAAGREFCSSRRSKDGKSPKKRSQMAHELLQGKGLNSHAVPSGETTKGGGEDRLYSDGGIKQDG